MVCEDILTIQCILVIFNLPQYCLINIYNNTVSLNTVKKGGYFIIQQPSEPQIFCILFSCNEENSVLHGRQ